MMFAKLTAPFLLLIAPAVAHAQAEDPAATQVSTLLEQRAKDVVAVFNGAKRAEEVFAEPFLAQVSPDMLIQLNSQLSAQFGPIIGVESVTPTGPFTATVAIRFERAVGRGPMTLSGEEPNFVVGLLLNDFQPIDDTLEKIQADIEALPGRASVLYAPVSGGEPILAMDENGQYAIGSTFKLYVLSALSRSIAAGEHSWDEVVRLDRSSFPSGQMQDWPEGAPVTLHTLATMMISISDNTATDMLIDVVGRDAIEAELRATGHSDPDRTLPFLSTLELFGLKGDIDRGTGYVAATEADQRRLLDEFAEEIDGNPASIMPPTFSKPTAIDTLEWFASGQDLRQLVQRMVEGGDDTALSIMAVSPGLSYAQQNKWDYVGYKGGSEPGVLNLTWLLRRDDGVARILTMSWNNTEASVDQTAFELLAQRILALEE
ncbi:serine hydrolase [Qipengyuania sp. JC766]|uniref:serine hydrolase n=1 Tax=Qipengyuania sp. JC766 TaxID=3232139 RepID=UPI0034593841